MNTVIWFPKPQVACSIHAGGTDLAIRFYGRQTIRGLQPIFAAQ